MINAGSQEVAHLKDYIRIIFKRKEVVAAVFIVLVASVTINSFMMEPIFKATCQLLIESENPNVVNIEEVIGVNTRDQDYYRTQYEILKGKSLAIKVIRELDLEDSPEFTFSKTTISPRIYISSIIGWIQKALAPVERKNAPHEENKYTGLVKSYLGKLIIDPVRNSRLVNISFEGRYPSLLAKMANTHARLYIESTLERKFGTSKEAVDWLNMRGNDVKIKLEEIERNLQEYREREGLASIDLEERQGIILQNLTDAGSELTKAKSERIRAEKVFLELKRLSQSPEMIESLPEVVSNQLIQDLKARHIYLSGEYHKLSQKYGLEHPNMISLASEINEIKEKTTQEVNKIANSIETEYRIAKTKEESIQKIMQDQKEEALELNQKQIKYSSLKRDFDVNNALYQSLLKRVNETALTEDLKITNISIIEPAQVPTDPVKPRILLNIFLAVLGGLGLGIALAFSLEYLDDTIKSPEQIETHFNLPVLGVIATLAKSSTNSINQELPALYEPESIISEAIRTIRTNLLCAASNKDKKAFLVTSTSALEGKTTVAGNLAIVFAQMGKKVLLIDADLRRPRIHKLFNLDNKAGLTEHLMGKESSIKNGAIVGLKIITSGAIPSNPVELLGSQKMMELIKVARDGFDFDTIIVDSPPVLAVADTMQIATLVDGVILVVKSGQNPAQAIKRCIQQFVGIHVEVYGCVLNNVNVRREMHYYSHYQYYYKNEYVKRKPDGENHDWPPQPHPSPV